MIRMLKARACEDKACKPFLEQFLPITSSNARPIAWFITITNHSNENSS